MPSLPQISIVIGTYQQRDVLKRVLDGYLSQTCSPDLFEVIIVDSGSNDGTDQLLDQFNSPFQFKGIIQQNQGKSGARNRGVKEAEGTYIIITDADMIPSPQFVATHLNAQLNTQRPTCFEGVTLNLTEYHWPPVSSKTYPYITRKYANNAPLGWYYFLTGNISFPKSLFVEENGFDMEFLGYGWEDLELGYRLEKRKIPLLYLKSAINYHYHIVTETEEISRNIKKGESAKIMLRKHPELKWFLGLNPLSVFIFHRISPNGVVINTLRRYHQGSSGVVQRFSTWFLKEYFYLSGLIG